MRLINKKGKVHISINAENKKITDNNNVIHPMSNKNTSISNYKSNIKGKKGEIKFSSTFKVTKKLIRSFHKIDFEMLGLKVDWRM